MSRKHDIEKINAIEEMLSVLKLKASSNYEKGVAGYAASMLEHLKIEIECGNESVNCANIFTFEKSLLAGASDIKEYSNGGYGAALCSNYLIAKTLCEPAKFEELEKTNNFGSYWSDMQVLAINAAWHILRCLYMAIDRLETDHKY